MSKTETILLFILLVIVVAFFSFLAFLAMKIYLDKKNNSSQFSIQSKPEEIFNINSPYQTEFFNKSIEYAEKILFGKNIDPQYGETGYYGNKLLDTLNKLNDETKKSIVVSIQYMTIEPTSARENERLYRSMAEQEKMPLWFIILREGSKKVIPDFFNAQSSTEVLKDNVVPLYNVA